MRTRTTHRGRHRRARTHHLPTAVGSLAVAAAAAGALTVGGPGATTSRAAPQSSTVASGPAIAASPAELARVEALRDQQRAERGTQRIQLAAASEAAAAATTLKQATALDVMAASRLARFAPPPAVLPVTGYRLTSRYGPRWGGFHTGLDMAVPTGTPIRAITAGEIIFATWDGPYGQKTIVRQDDGTELWYCHQSRFALRSGRVEAGDVIGFVGSTGNTTGPHVHVEIHPNGGDAVDPRSWLLARGLTV